jgi:murein L,D-transpeptidase YcbB/YkuD
MFKKALMVSIFLAGPAAVAAEPLRLSLNLPSYQLEVWEGEEKIRSYTVTIGAPDFPTPTGGFSITRIEWNPSWTPPPSPWARGAKKAPPGPNNPMGRAKLQFDDYLYVHGTVKEDELGGAHSHGCIRMSNADILDLARLVATHEGVLTAEEIDALENSSRRTRSVRLPEPIPIRIRYGLEEEVGGDIVELEDPYGWRETMRTVPTGSPLATLSRPKGIGEGRSSTLSAEARS